MFWIKLESGRLLNMEEVVEIAPTQEDDANGIPWWATLRNGRSVPLWQRDYDFIVEELKAIAPKRPT